MGSGTSYGVVQWGVGQLRGVCPAGSGPAKRGLSSGEWVS